MTLFEEQSSNQDDNYFKKTQKDVSPLVPSEQFSALRKCKSDLELSKCTCSTDMGLKMSRARSFVELQSSEVAKKRDLLDTSDFSDDDYQPLDSTEDELQTEDELESTLNQHNSTDQLQSDEEVAGCSRESSSEIQSGPKSESNDTAVVEDSEAVKKDFLLKCMTLPRTKPSSELCNLAPDTRSERSKSCRAAGVVSLLPGSRPGHECRTSLEKLKSCELLQNEPSTAPSAPTEISEPSDPDVFIVLLTEQQNIADSSRPRPRQYGRRSNPVRISSFAIESSDNGAAVSSCFVNMDKLMRIINKFFRESLRITISRSCNGRSAHQSEDPSFRNISHKGNAKVCRQKLVP